jgi:hypothetical protein
MTEQRSIIDVEAQACSQARASTEANSDRIRPEEPVSTATNNDFPTEEIVSTYDSVTSSGRGSSEEESIRVRDSRSRIKIALHLQSENLMRDSGITYNHRMDQKIRTRKSDSFLPPEVSADAYVHHSR